MGYHRAGFEVVGVDWVDQPNYPFEFVEADALGFLERNHMDFDAIHASPPCQLFSAMRKGRWQQRVHADLIKPVRALLQAYGKPFVIENVMGAPLRADLMLCGTMFGLQTKEGSQLRRHRIFELNFPIKVKFGDPLYCRHNDGSAIGVYGGGQHPKKRRPATIGVWGHAGGHSDRDGYDHYGIDARREAMGIDWMTGDELSQAIPPAYTQFIGSQLMAYIQESQSATNRRRD